MSAKSAAEPAGGNARCLCMVDYLKSVLKELCPAWLMRKAGVVDVRPVEQQPAISDLIGAAPPTRYRGPVRSEPPDHRLNESISKRNSG